MADQHSKASALGVLARWGNPVERFWSNVRKTEGCWEWTGTMFRGYGKIRAGGVFWRAHRYSWTLANGPIPDGLNVLHRCDNTKCVRPEHLFLGTHTDNMQDAQKKGRLRGRYSKPK